MQDGAKGPGNVRRIEHMMRAYGTGLLRLCHAMLRDAALAEEAAQDTFIKAYKGLDSFKDQQALSEKAWLSSIAVNTCRDYRRSAWFRRARAQLPLEAALMAPAPPLDSPDDSLAEEIIALPPKLKEVILLHYYQGFTYDEIAVMLAISRSTVRARLNQARKRLKTTLEGWNTDERRQSTASD